MRYSPLRTSVTVRSKIAVLQMTAGVDPAKNSRVLTDAIHRSADAGAVMLFTPEMSGLLDRDSARAASHIDSEDDDLVLRAVREAAADAGLWVSLGSLAVRGSVGGKLCNRGFVIDANGTIAARYNKMHLFDVDLPGESWLESARYSAGATPVAVDTPIGRVGLSICYDVRFPALYQVLSAAGAQILSVPAAFTLPTGEAHWHVLLRARAIENAAYVVAAAQTGRHDDGRTTFGHSVVIDPSGEVTLDMGREPGLGFADVDLDMVDAARARIPVLSDRRAIPALEAKAR